MPIQQWGEEFFLFDKKISADQIRKKSTQYWPKVC